MCMFGTQKQKPPTMPAEYAQQKQPNLAQGAAAGQRQRDRLRSAASTVLTGTAAGTGAATTQKKTLLGM